MTRKLNIGDIACYQRQDLIEDTLVLILGTMFYDPTGIKYFRCLVNNRIETICEVWLKNYGKQQ